MKFSYYLWLLYIVIFPFYFFSEGNPQIADAFGVLIIALNLRSILVRMTENKFTKYLLYFVIYSFLVNTIWMLIIGDILVLRNSLYYLYSFFLLMFVITKLNDNVFIKYTLTSLFISLTLQFILLPFVADQGFRVQLYFNNPNQLALWGLCLLIIINSLNLILPQKFYIVLIASILCTFFIFISASRSAFICAILFWLFFYIKSRKNIIIMSFIIMLFLIYALLSESVQIKNIAVLNYIIDRLAGDQVSSDSGLAGRGFDRLLEFPQYLFFGAGEGFEERFNSNIELHSTFLNLIFSYGILGFYFAGRAMLMIITKSYREIIILFLILSVFGQVHMILRIPLFWVSLVILYYAKTNKINKSISIP